MVKWEDNFKKLYDKKDLRLRAQKQKVFIDWINQEKVEQILIDYLSLKPGQEKIKLDVFGDYKDIISLLLTTSQGQKFLKKNVGESSILWKKLIQNKKFNRLFNHKKFKNNKIEDYIEKVGNGSLLFFIRYFGSHDSLYVASSDIISAYSGCIFKEECKAIMNASKKKILSNFDNIPVNVSNKMNEALSKSTEKASKKVLVELRETYYANYKRLNLKVSSYYPKLTKLESNVLAKLSDTKQKIIKQSRKKKIYALVEANCYLRGKEVNLVDRIKKNKASLLQSSIAMMNLSFSLDQLFNTGYTTGLQDKEKLSLDLVNAIQGTAELVDETVKFLNTLQDAEHLKFYKTSKIAGRISGVLTLALDVYSGYQAIQEENLGKFIGASFSSLGSLVYLLALLGGFTCGLTTAFAFVLSAIGLGLQIAFEPNWMGDWIEHCFLGKSYEDEDENFPEWGNKKISFKDWSGDFELQIDELHKMIQVSMKKK